MYLPATCLLCSVLYLTVVSNVPFIVATFLCINSCPLPLFFTTTLMMSMYTWKIWGIDESADGKSVLLARALKHSVNSKLPFQHDFSKECSQDQRHIIYIETVGISIFLRFVFAITLEPLHLQCWNFAHAPILLLSKEKKFSSKIFFSKKNFFSKIFFKKKFFFIFFF